MQLLPNKQNVREYKTIFLIKKKTQNGKLNK